MRKIKKIGDALELLVFALAVACLASCASNHTAPNLGTRDSKLSATSPIAGNTETSPSDSDLSCKTDDDCTLTTKDCCKCSEGGDRIAVAVAAQKAYEAALEDKCKGIVCAQHVNSGGCCADDAKAQCIKGQCTAICPAAQNPLVRPVQ